MQIQKYKFMIHEEICTCEVAMLAKEKGAPLQKVIKQDSRAFFYELPQSHPDWANCDTWYLPTQSQLQRWLREEKGIIVIPYYRSVLRMWSATYELTSPYTFEDLRKRFKTYELALEDALKYALENLV